MDKINTSPDTTDRLNALERRVAMLEIAMLTHPVALAPTLPVPFYHTLPDCTCPIGAETRCKGPGCPRRRWKGPIV